jgi:hypothetical protein
MLAQWKSDGLITRKCLDRNEDMYDFFGHIAISSEDKTLFRILRFIWDEFCRILGIKLKLSTSDHPQTDGQTEIWNQYMAQKLRPFVNHYLVRVVAGRGLLRSRSLPRLDESFPLPCG